MSQITPPARRSSFAEQGYTQLQRLIRRRDLLTKMNAVYHGS